MKRVQTWNTIVYVIVDGTLLPVVFMYKIKYKDFIKKRFTKGIGFDILTLDGIRKKLYPC